MASPTISIVTPSFNQGQFLEATLRSVLDQAYPALEYVVVDGGSKDESPAIVARYADRLHYSVSEPDGGMYEAINKGFAHSSGEIMGWLNSDDLYFPWTLSVVGDVFAAFPEVDWITTNFPATWDGRGRLVNLTRFDAYRQNEILNGRFLPGGKWFARGWIQQESTFWRRRLWERAGARLATEFRRAADFELWLRFAKHARLVGVDTLLGGFRVHAAQQTQNYFDQYWEEAQRAMTTHGQVGSTAYGVVRRTAERVLRRLSLASRMASPTAIGLAASCSPRTGEWSLRRT